MSDWAEQGRKAYIEGVALKDCPYSSDPFSESCSEWELGWKIAKEQAAKKPVKVKEKAITIYTKRPTSGTGALAWDRFVAAFGREPGSIQYTPNHCGERGWICEYFGENYPFDPDKHAYRGHGRALGYEFYPSAFFG